MVFIKVSSRLSRLTTGTFPMLAFMTIISICSIIFVGGSSTRGPRGTYTVPEAGGFSYVHL